MKKVIFLVDDDKEDKELMEAAFTELDYYSVHYYSSVQDLLRSLKLLDETALPSLIITDYQMPVMDGFNLVSFLKRHDKFNTINVVILTSSITENEKKRLTKAGASKIYTKPSFYNDYKTIASELKDLALGFD